MRTRGRTQRRNHAVRVAGPKAARVPTGPMHWRWSAICRKPVAGLPNKVKSRFCAAAAPRRGEHARWKWPAEQWIRPGSKPHRSRGSCMPPYRGKVRPGGHPAPAETTSIWGGRSYTHLCAKTALHAHHPTYIYAVCERPPHIRYAIHMGWTSTIYVFVAVYERPPHIRYAIHMGWTSTIYMCGGL